MADQGPVSVARYGADLTGATPSDAAWRACYAHCAANKRSMFIPGGTHLLSQEFVADYSAWDSNNDEKGPSIIGEGAGVVEVRGIVRLQGGIGAGCHTYVGVSGLKFCGKESGLRLDNIAFIRLSEIFLNGCADGLIATDSLSMTLDNVRTRWCSRGMTFHRVNGSKPNAITLVGCHVGSGSDYGILVAAGSQFVMLGGSIEGNGEMGKPSYGLRHTGHVTQGQNGLCLTGVYFEGNAGVADIWINSGSQDCVHLIQGCNFNRTSDTRFADHNIRVNQSDAQGDGVPYLTINACSFVGFNTYVADASRPYIKVTADRAIITQAGNYFADDAEAYQQ